MKKQTLKLKNPLLVFALSLWVLSSVYPAYAQQSRWLRVTSLQSPINEIGAEYEGEFATGNTNFFSWPAQYGIGQNTCRARGMWIGCRNFYDPVEEKVKSYKVIDVGPRVGTYSTKIFPQVIKLIGKSYHPIVTVDDRPASELYLFDILDEMDPNLGADRIVLVKFNTSIGISVTKKVMAFEQSNHDNYFIKDFVFTNTGIYDSANNARQQILDSVYFYFSDRYSFAGVGRAAYNQGWGSWNSTWGESNVTHSIGGDPTAPGFEMRAAYTWYGPDYQRSYVSYVSYDEDWGNPAQTEDGELASAKYAGSVTLHADKSVSDRSDDRWQPRTNNFINADLPIMQKDVSQYNETVMADRWAAITDGHPAVQHDVLVDDNYALWYRDPRRNNGAGVQSETAYGPYRMEPGDSIHIVIADGVAGISWEKGREVGGNWLQWWNKIGDPALVIPDGSTTTDYNLYKRKWCETGKDSILQTYRNAVRNYNSGYQIPKPPPPPNEFNVTSRSDRITLEWASNPDAAPHFNGYVIYRSMGNVLDRKTVYEKIFECNKANVVHSFDDITAKRDSGYYYYIQSKDDGSTNDVHPGVPLASSKFHTMTTIRARVANPNVDTTGQWAQINGFHGGSVKCLVVDPNGDAGVNNLFAGTDGGVFLSANNGTSWTSTGLTNTYVNAFAVFPNWASGTNLFTGTAGSGVFLSTNNGASWTPVNIGLTSSNVRALAVSSTNLFAGTSGGVFLNNGTSWTPVNSGLTNLYVNALAVSGMNLFAGTNGGVFLSTNNGTRWTQVNSGLTNLSVNALVVSGTNLFAGTNGGGIFLSTNNGTSWTATGLTNTYINAFTVSPDGTGGTNLFAGTNGGGIFLSTNDGTSWTEVDAGLPNTDVLALAVSTDGAGSKYLFAGTLYGGVWRRPLSEMVTTMYTIFAGDANNDGIVDARDILPIGRYFSLTGPARTGVNLTQTPAQHWSSGESCYADCDGNGIINANDVQEIVNNWSMTHTSSANPSVNKIEVCNQLLGEIDRQQPLSNGMKEIRNAVLNIMKHESGGVFNYVLDQNWPNPFNPSTTIRFTVPEEVVMVRLDVFNLLGQLVWSQTLNNVLSGVHEVEWQGETTTGSMVASGVYFYRLSAGNFTSMKRMLLIK